MPKFTIVENLAEIKKADKVLREDFDEKANSSVRRGSQDAEYRVAGRKGQVCIRLYEKPDPQNRGGILLTDGKKNYIAHTGNFSVTGQGIREYYLENTLRHKVSVQWKGDSYEIVLIDAVDAKSFYKEMENFIAEVLDIKDRHADENDVTPQEKKEIEIINKSKDITETERYALLKSRRGQGQFKSGVLKLSPTCLFTGIKYPTLLTAGHIKPWVDSDNKEKLDPHNGFLLTPTYDRLFDRNLISFDKMGKLLVSSLLDKSICQQLNLKVGTLYAIEALAKREKYLAFHRQRFFQIA